MTRMTMNKNDPPVEERKDLNYDASRKQKSSEKTARIPIKIVPLEEMLKKPDWIRVKAASGNSRFSEIKKILRENELVTVCEEASCPNIGECFGKGTATVSYTHLTLPTKRIV